MKKTLIIFTTMLALSCGAILFSDPIYIKQPNGTDFIKQELKTAGEYSQEIATKKNQVLEIDASIARLLIQRQGIQKEIDVMVAAQQ